MTPPSRYHHAFLLAILLFAGACRLWTLNLPFGRDSEGCGAFYGLLARNYFRYDLSQTHGIPVMSMGQGSPPLFYANHPAITPLLIAGAYAAAGYQGEFDRLPADALTRLPTAIFTMGCIALIYFMVKRRATPRAGLIAAAIFASIPMTIVFGGLPDVISPQMVFFALLTLAAYERFHDQPTAKHLTLLCLAFTGAGITDWPAFYLIPVLLLHFVLTRKVRQWPGMILFCAISTGLFILLYAHLTLGQDDWLWMLQQFKRRSVSNSSDGASAFTFGQWFKHAVWEMAIARHTLIVAILALLWIATAPFRKFTGKADRLIVLLFAWAAIHILLGRQGLYQHEWWWWVITPGLVIAAAVGFDGFFTNRRSANIALVVGLIVFSGWNIRSAVVEYRIVQAKLPYSLAEIGEAIRTNTPPDRIAVLTESDMSLAFWAYADRALKRDVWDLPTFQRRLNDISIEISFNKFVDWQAPVSTMIIPKAYFDKTWLDLRAHLEANYPRRDLEKFVVYDLSKPR